jgi:nitrogen PTS system EIIA component
MDLTVQEAAKLLGMSEEELHRWIREGTVPAHKVEHQYRLNRVELQEWAASQRRDVPPDLFKASTTASGTSLPEALEKGGVNRGLPGASRERILQEVSRLPGIPDRVDRAMLLELLLARETIGSTSVGRGIALPHPRDPLVLGLRHARVLLVFPAEPVDFRAVDGQPVHAIFLLLSPSVRVHLELLAKLAHALHDETLNGLLCARAPDADILARFFALERNEPRSCSSSS